MYVFSCPLESYFWKRFIAGQFCSWSRDLQKGGWPTHLIGTYRKLVQMSVSCSNLKRQKSKPGPSFLQTPIQAVEKVLNDEGWTFKQLVCPKFWWVEILGHGFWMMGIWDASPSDEYNPKLDLFFTEISRSLELWYGSESLGIIRMQIWTWVVWDTLLNHPQDPVLTSKV